MLYQENGPLLAGLPAWIGQRHTLSGGQVFKGASHAGTAIGCGDRPGDELRRSHDWLERGHHWTCGGVRMNSRSAVLSFQTDKVQ